MKKELEVSLENKEHRNCLTLREAVRSGWDLMDERFHGSSTSGMTTGYRELDHSTGGFGPNQLWVIAGFPQAGVLAFIYNLIYRQSLESTAGVVWSTDREPSQLGLSLVCIGANLDQVRIASGHLEQDDWEKLARQVQKLYDNHLCIISSPILTVKELEPIIETRLSAEERQLVIFITDYWRIKRSKGGEPLERLRSLCLDYPITFVVGIEFLTGVEAQKWPPGRKDCLDHGPSDQTMLTAPTHLLLVSQHKVKVSEDKGGRRCLEMSLILEINTSGSNLRRSVIPIQLFPHSGRMEEIGEE